MGRARTVHSRSPLQDAEINPVAIRYTLAKRVAMAEDVAAGLSLREVAIRHNVSMSTVHAAAHSPEVQEIINPKIVEIRKKSLANAFDYHADLALSRLTPEKWDKASALQHLIGAATAVDKAKVLRHEANVIVGVDTAVESTLAEVERIKKERESCSLLLVSHNATNDANNQPNVTNGVLSKSDIDNNTPDIPPTQGQIVDVQQVNVKE